jgi:hypothetical protein
VRGTISYFFRAGGFPLVFGDCTFGDCSFGDCTFGFGSFGDCAVGARARFVVSRSSVFPFGFGEEGDETELRGVLPGVTLFNPFPRPKNLFTLDATDVGEVTCDWSSR